MKRVVLFFLRDSKFLLHPEFKRFKSIAYGKHASKFSTVMNKDTIGIIKLLERKNYVCIIGNKKRANCEAEDNLNK